MSKILGLDFESTGDDVKNDHITEVGAMLVEPKNNCYEVLEKLQQFVYEPHYPKLSPFIQDLTGITDDKLETNGIDPVRMLGLLAPLMESADYIVAHNKKFDQNLLEAVATRYKFPLPKKTWICSYTEVPYPEKYTCRKLSHLALDHGMDVSGRRLHRALDDVELMLDFMFKYYKFEDVISYAKEPWVYLRARIPAPWEDGGVGKAQATKLGYSWERARGTDEPIINKCWVKRVKQAQVTSETTRAPFEVIILGPK